MNPSPTRDKSLCMNFFSYVSLPSKRSFFYDFVLIDGLCRHYAAYFVSQSPVDYAQLRSRLRQPNTPVLIRGEDLYQYKDISHFLSQYYEKQECMDAFEPSKRHDYYGLCVYRAKPLEETKSLLVPRWW